jgi:hypothetical protein
MTQVTYTPATSGPRITHTPGTPAPRPLEVGDTLDYGNGRRDVITGAGVSMLFTRTATGRQGWEHRAPCEGDMSGVIVAVES